MRNLRKLRSKGNYSKIIEVLVPVRFYWTREGEFDGLEMGPFDDITEYEKRLCRDIIYQMYDLLDSYYVNNEEINDIPESFIRAFESDGENK